MIYKYTVYLRMLNYQRVVVCFAMYEYGDVQLSCYSDLTYYPK